MSSDDFTRSPDDPVTLTWKPSGPIWVDGPVVVRRNDGEILEAPPTKVPGRIKLCGCGRSRNKPFCDGEHKR